MKRDWVYRCPCPRLTSKASLFSLSLFLSLTTAMELEHTELLSSVCFTEDLQKCKQREGTVLKPKSQHATITKETAERPGPSGLLAAAQGFRAWGWGCLHGQEKSDFMFSLECKLTSARNSVSQMNLQL